MAAQMGGEFKPPLSQIDTAQPDCRFGTGHSANNRFNNEHHSNDRPGGAYSYSQRGRGRGRGKRVVDTVQSPRSKVRHYMVFTHELIMETNIFAQVMLAFLQNSLLVMY